MKALLYTLDGKIKEFEVRGATPYFILLEADGSLDDSQGVPIGVVKGAERLFRLISGGIRVASYAESGVKPEYFRKRESEARLRYNYDYAMEMDHLASCVSSPEFSIPITGKIERYAEWAHKPYYVPLPKPISIKADPAAIKKFNPGPKWDPPIQTVYVDDKANVFDSNGDPLDKPFSNITYTPKPEPPPREPDVIGEPKKRLLLIVKEEAE
jgi:hypothetical protein